MTAKVQSTDIEPDVRLRKKYRTVWYGIRNRCYNPGVKSYQDYGGRGISLSEDFSDFRVFLLHLRGLDHYGVPGFELDRINNENGYRSGNLRFVTRQQNCKNRRSTLTVQYRGGALCFSDFLALHAEGLPPSTAHRWYHNYKISLEEIVERARIRREGGYAGFWSPKNELNYTLRGLA